MGGTYDDVGDKEDPLEAVPAHAGLSAPASLAPEPTAIDPIVIVVRLPGHAGFSTLERLPAAPSFREHRVDAFAFTAAADARHHEGGGELGREVVDAEGDGAGGVAEEGGVVAI